MLKTIGLIAFCTLPAFAVSQTVIVNKSATPNSTTFNSISDALSAVASDPAEPNVIQVTDSEKYDEVFTINTPVTLEATAPERPTLLVNHNSQGTFEVGGIVVNLPSSITSGSVTLRNFIILPSAFTSGIPLRTAIENINNNLFLTVENCLITANDGNNEPIVTDGTTSRYYEIVPSITDTYNSNIIPWGDAGLQLGRSGSGRYEGAGVELLFKDSIITHFRGDMLGNPSNPQARAIEMASSYTFNMPPPLPAETRITRIEGASAISFAKSGLYVTGDLIMKSDGERIQMRAFATEAIHLVGGAPNQRLISDAVIVGGTNHAIWDQGVGSVRFSIKNAIIAHFGGHVIRVGKPSNYPADGLISIEDSTLVAGRTFDQHAWRIESGTNVDFDIRNSILAGQFERPTNGLNVIWMGGNIDFNMDGVAIVQEGPYAFRHTETTTWYSKGPNVVINGEPTTTADPLFDDYVYGSSDPFSADFIPPSTDFLNVRNEAYATTSATGGPLGGGAQYVGGMSFVPDWQLY